MLTQRKREELWLLKDLEKSDIDRVVIVMLGVSGEIFGRRRLGLC